MVASTILLIIVSLLPWGKVVSSIRTFVIRGSEGDGVLTAVIGVIAAAILTRPSCESKISSLGIVGNEETDRQPQKIIVTVC